MYREDEDDLKKVLISERNPTDLKSVRDDDHLDT